MLGLRLSAALHIASLAALQFAAIQPATADSRQNLALHRPYKLEPAPNYGGATSPNGATELTDGVTTPGGTMWTQRTAVGWSRVRPVTVTIDLGQVTTVGEITWHGAAGASGVEWPWAIYAYASEDGNHFTALGDLVALDAARSGPPPVGKYAEHTFTGPVGPVYARYVRLMVDPHDPYVFVDEIQIFGGTPQATSSTAATVTDTTADFWRAHASFKAADVIQKDAARIRARLAQIQLPTSTRSKLDSKAASSAASAAASARASALDHASLPLNSAHAAIFAALGSAEQSSGEPALQAWPANPWTPLLPEDPKRGVVPAQLDIMAMRGERRSSAINIRNSSPEDAIVDISIDLDGVKPAQIQIAPVAWTETEPGIWIAAKIVAPETTFNVPAGVTEQAWITLDAGESSPGLHMGRIHVRSRGGAAVELPLAFRVFATHFPAHTTLLLQGWDYLQGTGASGITDANIDAVGNFLRSQDVNVAWAMRTAMDVTGIDANGHLTHPPSTRVLERWLARWPTASRYRVFLSVKNDISGISISDPRFNGAVKEWANYWAAAVRRLGKQPADFDLELVDEPRTDAMAQTVLAWARAIKSSSAGFHLWVNPNWADPSATPPEILNLFDVICINLHIAQDGGERYWQWARQLAAHGKWVELYGTDGPAKQLDPYAYYRLMSWRANDVGARGIGFWSFSDTGGGESSNAFASQAIDYVPYFLDHAKATNSKEMVAIREGLQDYEYLRLLSTVASNAADSAKRASAQQLLNDSRNTVLSAAGSLYSSWTTGRDRSVADAWRYKIGAFLDGANTSGY